MPRAKKKPKGDPLDLESAIASFYYDPYGFVLFAYPWKEPGTDLEDEEGPDDWQKKVLIKLGRECRRRGDGAVAGAIQIAVASGHGIGKTALIAWIIEWFISTRPAPHIVTTANTKQQLEQKTWRELSKWHRLSVNEPWFTWRATKFYKKGRAADWFASAVPWSKERAQAFAGTHDEHVLMLFDEGSEIEDVIWETAEGAMTTSGAIWVVFGNPTKNTGRFRECFARFRHRWLKLQVDSRTAKKANQAQLQQWIDDYGEDSDFVRVRVKGQFPRAGSTQLIPLDVVEEAQRREATDYETAGISIGVDPAYMGDDQSVIYVRQGFATLAVKKFRGLDGPQLAYRVTEAMEEFGPDIVVVDRVGIGASCYDHLIHIGHQNIEGVNAGTNALDKERFFNLGAQLWWSMLEWLKAGGAIPADDQELRDDLIGRQYGYAKGRVQLEKKTDMKDRGQASPDTADALSLTFYAEPAPRPILTLLQKKLMKLRQKGSWMAR